MLDVVYHCLCDVGRLWGLRGDLSAQKPPGAHIYSPIRLLIRVIHQSVPWPLLDVVPFYFLFHVVRYEHVCCWNV